MIATKVSLDCDRIGDWRSFHEEFAKAFGFPDFYGKNMNAWIDCMTYIDDPASGMSAIHCERGSVLALELLNVKSFRERCPELYEAVADGVAFVNWRRLPQRLLAFRAMSVGDENAGCLLTFEAARADRSGGYHEIAVRVDRPNLNVRTIRGYYQDQ